MIETISKSVTKWIKSTDDRRKLQHVYLLIAVLVLFASGIISLINPELGRNVLKLSGFSLVIYLINAIVWHLIDSFIVSRSELIQTSFVPQKRK